MIDAASDKGALTSTFEVKSHVIVAEGLQERGLSNDRILKTNRTELEIVTKNPLEMLATNAIETDKFLFIDIVRERVATGITTAESVRLKVFCRDRLTLNATSAERVWYLVDACFIAPRTDVNVAVAEIVRYMPLTIETANVELALNVRRIDKDFTKETIGVSVAERER